MKTRQTILGIGMCAGMLAWGLCANAVPVTFSGSSGVLSASVTFDVVGGNLQVTLVNTSAGDPSAPSDILTGVLFNIAGDPSLSRLSAVLGSGSTVISGTTDPGNVVGGEWAYSSGVSIRGANEAIYSSGYFSGNARFPGHNLQGPNSVDGVQYGITTLNDTAGNNNGGLSGQGLIQNSVVFTLGSLPLGFLLSDISAVDFQYGTALTEGHFTGYTPPPPGVPDGGTTVALLGMALACLGCVRAQVGKR
jgi:VPDSG-CTERM motif